MPVAVVIALFVVALALGVVAYELRRRSSSGVDLDELRRLATSLPPSPRRSVVRLRVELHESVDAAEAAVEVLGPDGAAMLHDLDGLGDRLLAESRRLEATLASVQERSDAALGPLVPVLRDRVREVQHVADGIIELARRSHEVADPEVRALGRRVADELAVVEAHRELPS